MNSKGIFSLSPSFITIRSGGEGIENSIVLWKGIALKLPLVR